MAKTNRLPENIEPIGVGETIAHRVVGLSQNPFRKAVADGLMPRPFRIGGRNLYSLQELRDAFHRLPRRGEEPETEADKQEPATELQGWD